MKRTRWRYISRHVRLTKKQKQLALDLFGTDRLTARQFARMMEERKEASQDAYDRTNEVDLLSLAEKHTKMTNSGNTRTGPCPMPNCTASKDGFWVDTRTNTGGCHTCFWPVKNGSGSGPVGFIRALTGGEAWEARDHLVGEVQINVPVRRKKPIDASKSTTATKDFANVMRGATQALKASDGLGRWGRNYLMGKRGLRPETWEYFGVGVTTDYGNRPFIASPFHHVDNGQLCGIRYSNAKISMTGSKVERAIFGRPKIKGHEIGFMIEGEVNAMSIRQACWDLDISADVISTGSQGAFMSLAADAARHLSQARFIVLWADEAKIGESARPYFEKIGVTVEVLFSYQKQDANSTMKAGQLTHLLSHVLPNRKPFFVSPVGKNEEVVEVTACASSANQETDTQKADIETLLREGRFDEAKIAARQIKNAGESGKWLRRIASMKKEKKIQEEQQEATQILYWCGLIADKARTKEADTLYRKAEDLHFKGMVADLYSHYMYMKEVCTSSPMEQMKLPLSTNMQRIRQ